jgi:SAM-dependent methyltransferase
VNLRDVVRDLPSAGWSKIPWHEPGFSERMLEEHLSDEHDRASRRAEVIDRHVAWIHALAGRPCRILDLGCGPGLYTRRLAALGHDCLGVDFSPASIEYARRGAGAYVLGDIRDGVPATGFDVALLIFGEFNTFAPDDARRVLANARAALVPGGRLVLEIEPVDSVRARGRAGRSWFAAERGLFSERPHVCLAEASWDGERRATTERYLVIDAATGEVEHLAQSSRALSNDEVTALLEDAGFEDVRVGDGLEGPLLTVVATAKEE